MMGYDTDDYGDWEDWDWRLDLGITKIDSTPPKPITTPKIIVKEQDLEFMWKKAMSHFNVKETEAEIEIVNPSDIDIRLEELTKVFKTATDLADVRYDNEDTNLNFIFKFVDSYFTLKHNS